MTQRQAIEATGFEALQHLYEVAIGNAGQCESVARFLLALYDGQRFPLDLAELRALDAAVFEDCAAVLRMDARVSAREVHTYFADGGRKFEALAKAWDIEDLSRVREAAKRAAQPEGMPAPLHEGGHFEAKMMGYGNAPGYRDVTLRLRVGPGHNTEISAYLDAQEARDLMEHIGHVHAFSWREGSRPIDANEGEQRPAWLDQTPARRAGYT
jgi:hypothetical protein